MSYRESLVEHLAWWGLKRFDSDAAYFRWQREALSAGDIAHLNHLVEEKRLPDAGAGAEAAFYDFSARPHILPVLYSQRYDYYLTVAPLVAERIGKVRSVLDFGCGPGILTTFYARRLPDVSFVGIDRSDASVKSAQEQAAALGLTNVRFESVDVEQSPLSGEYDCIICTHALLQSEVDPGIPSVTWQTFDRPNSRDLQTDYEQRTGLAARLDALCRVLAPQGRLIVFDKTRQLARRVPFQRALSARGCRLLEPPILLRYLLVEEVADDGPFYVLTHESAFTDSEKCVPWDEGPEHQDGDELYRCDGESGKFIWECLPDRTVTQVESWNVPQHGLVRVERGKAAGSLAYLYLTLDEHVCGLFVGGQANIETANQRTVAVRALLDSIGSAPLSPGELAHLPLYENHTVSAQSIWSRLPEREILKVTTLEESGGRQMHVELGRVPGLIYLYWANTFDQRQVVMVETSRAHVLERYYEEFLIGR